MSVQIRQVAYIDLVSAHRPLFICDNHGPFLFPIQVVLDLVESLSLNYFSQRLITVDLLELLIRC